MDNKVGVWVDHQKAVVVRISDSGEEVIHVESGAESQLRRSGDQTSGPFEPLQVPSDDTRERKYKAELNNFYDEVILHLMDSKSVYICGPGEARKELRNRMDVKHSINGDVVLDAADSMTNAQVVAKIRRHFQLG